MSHTSSLSGTTFGASTGFKSLSIIPWLEDEGKLSIGLNDDEQYHSDLR